MEHLVPQIKQHMLQSVNAIDAIGQRQDPVYLAALERFSLAWAERRKVEVLVSKELEKG